VLVANHRGYKMFNPKLDFVVCCNAFRVDDKYFIKEISLVACDLRLHFNVRLPPFILTSKLSSKDVATTWFCEKVLHHLKFANSIFDCPLSVVTNVIKRLQLSSPNSSFFVKGDQDLRNYLTRVCRVTCKNLSPCPRAYSGNENNARLKFCPLHSYAKCSFFKATFYFEQNSINPPYPSTSDTISSADTTQHGRPSDSSSTADSIRKDAVTSSFRRRRAST
jgi:hypothetical protein